MSKCSAREIRNRAEVGLKGGEGIKGGWEGEGDKKREH